MKSEDMMEAITELGDDLIREAGEAPDTHKMKSRRSAILAACALLALVLLAGGILLFGGKGPKAQAEALVKPTYPSQEQWWERVQNNRGAEEAYRGFFADVIQQLLTGGEQENLVMSPINIFMATAMLGEITEGESRQEILNVLGADSLETLREQARKVWELCYFDNGREKVIPANSLWLSGNLSYGEDTVKTLAREYYASVFRGEMGDPAYDQLLRDWLNEQTGGLLKDRVDQLGFQPDSETPLRLISTLYLQAKWLDHFLESHNRELVFHGSEGDKTVTFLHRDYAGSWYYYSDKFIFFFLPTFRGRVWFFLPDEGVSLEEMMQEESFRAFLESPKVDQYRRYDEAKHDYVSVNYRGAQASEYTRVNVSIPKLDYSCTQDLMTCLKALGIHSALDPQKADFSPLIQGEGIYLQEASQSSRLIMDEEGVSAASYVEYLPGAMLPPKEEVDIVLDRPYFFLVTGAEDMPLFAGVVNQP